ncbi:MAG: SUMF1/EgtB/PvdO family nonheme iron enzyme [Spirochaetes bacterium]|nr:SUMF1/EgtB/PvdO family nonheme iron enzyme [Spirochaetota bacterium]
MMKSNNTFRSRAAAPFLRGTVALALVAALALAAAGAEEFRILGAVDAVRGDGIATVIFPERAGRGAYLIIEDGRAIGEVRIIDLPCYRNGRFGFYRCMAEYAIGEKKDRVLLKAGSPVGISIKKETMRRDFSEKPAPVIVRLKERVTGARDGREMVLVPGGRFVFGSNAGAKDEYPEQIAELGDYYIDRLEVSNAEYLKYVREMNVAPPATWNGVPRDDAFPVVVSFGEAEGYARWAGKRLPTEMEWEMAARGSGLGYQRNPDETYVLIKKPVSYPWGAAFDPSRANTVEFWPSPGVRADYTTKYQKGYLPVSLFEGAGESPCGALNMAGNAMEWTSSWYRGYKGNAYGNSKFGTMYRVVRGGAWYSSRHRSTVTSREPAGAPGLDRDTAGFRCVREPTVLDVVRESR